MKKWAQKIFISIWFFVGIVLLGALGAQHFVVFKPASVLPIKNSNSWKLVHIMTADCKCSENIAQAILKRGLLSGVEQEVVWLSHDENPLYKSLVQIGISVTKMNPELYESQNSGGVPNLMIMNPSGKIVYTGGYAESKVISGAPIRDLEVLESLKSGRSVAVFPIFGCAASKKLKNLIDPLRIKYTSRGEQ